MSCGQNRVLLPNSSLWWPVKVLLDRNIERNAITHRTVLASHKIKWGSSKSVLHVAQRAPFPPRPDEEFRVLQLPYLAALCDQARSGKFEFFTSPELNMEKLRQRGCDQGYLGLNMLSGIKVEQAHSPIQRIVVVGGGSSIGTTKIEQMDFFCAIRHPRFLAIRKSSAMLGQRLLTKVR